MCLPKLFLAAEWVVVVAAVVVVAVVVAVVGAIVTEDFYSLQFVSVFGSVEYKIFHLNEVQVFYFAFFL